MMPQPKTKTALMERQKEIRRKIAAIDRKNGERDGNLIKSAILLESDIRVKEAKKDFLEKELVNVTAQILTSKAKFSAINECILNSTCQDTIALSKEYERNEVLLSCSEATPRRSIVVP